MPPHSIASTATAIETSSRYGSASRRPLNAGICCCSAPSTAYNAAGTSTTAEATLRPRFGQSKPLACGKDVISLDGPVAAVTGLVLGDRRLQMLRAVVGPQDVLEDELGVG